MDVSELAAGTDIAGRYQVLRRLGGGGSAQTYAAVERASGRTVAIKVFTLRGGAWKTFELFEREAAVLARLDHPAIPKLVESFTADTAAGPTFYLVESFVEGRTLAEEALATRADEAGARRVALELLAILTYLQRLNPPVVHRDIKPANILRTTSGALSLVDFGSVRAKDSGAEGNATTIVGTYGFMAPEQYRGIALPATDLHGLGATLVFLMTGRAPDQLPQQKLRPELPASLGLSPHFKAWLDRLLEPAPEDRFQTADEAARTLLAGKLGRVKKSRRVWALAGALVAVTGAGSALLYGEIAPLLGSVPGGEVASAQPQLPPQGKLLPMPGMARTIDLKRVTTLNAHTHAISCIRTSPDGKLMVTGAGDHSLKVWSTESWALLRTLTGHTDTVWGCGFSEDSKLIVSTGDSSVRVFDAASGAQLASANADAGLNRLHIFKDRVISGSIGKAVAWQLPSLAPLPSLPLDGRVLEAAIARDGSMTALTGEAGFVRLFRPGAEPADLRAHVGPISSVAFSPDGTLLASAGDDGTVRIWTVQNAKLWRTISGSPGTEAWYLAWSPDGGTLLVGDKAGTITSFRFPTGQTRWRWERKGGPVSALSISSDGKYAFVGSMKGNVEVFAFAKPAAPDSIPRPKADLVNPPLLPGLAREAERLVNEGIGKPRGLDQAEALTLKALAQNPRDAVALVQRARIARARGLISGSKYRPEALDEAKGWVEKALAVQPNLPEAYAFLAAFHTAVGETLPASDKARFEPARAAVAKLVELEPESSRAFLLQAALADAEDSPEEAQKRALRALELATTKREADLAYGELGDAYESLNELDAADICHRRQLELDEGSAWARGNYALFLRRRGYIEEAKAMVDAAIKVTDYPMAHHYLASLYTDSGNDSLWSMRIPDHARELYERALKERPNHAPALYGLAAVAYYEASRDGVACAACGEWLKAAQKADPSNKDIERSLAIVK